MRILNLHKYFKILNHFGFFPFFYTLLSRFRIKYHIKINEKKKFYKLLNLLKIYKTNFKLIKIGDNSDGTYILPNILKKINFCFSIGVGNIIKFEKYLFKNYKINSFLIDNTITGEIVKKQKGLFFLKKNLSLVNDNKNITLESLLNKFLPKKNQKNLLLQADIEGDENYIINKLSHKLLKKFSVLVFEFHFFSIISSKKGLDRIIKIFSLIEKNFTLVYLHPNNVFAPFKVNGYLLPCIAEITFINNDLIKSKKNLGKDDLFVFKNIKKFDQIILDDFHFSKKN